MEQGPCMGYRALTECTELHFLADIILYLILFCLGRDCLKALWGLEIEGEGLM